MGIIQQGINAALLAGAAAYKVSGGPEISKLKKAKLELADVKNEQGVMDPERVKIREKKYVEQLFNAAKATGNINYQMEGLKRQENILKAEGAFNQQKMSNATTGLASQLETKQEQKEMAAQRRDYLKEQISFGKGAKATIGELNPKLRDRILAQLEEEDRNGK